MLARHSLRSRTLHPPQTAKLGSLVEVQDSEDPEGLRVFYYLVQDLKVRCKGGQSPTASLTFARTVPHLQPDQSALQGEFAADTGSMASPHTPGPRRSSPSECLPAASTCTISSIARSPCVPRVPCLPIHALLRALPSCCFSTRATNAGNLSSREAWNQASTASPSPLTLPPLPRTSLHTFAQGSAGLVPRCRGRGARWHRRKDEGPPPSSCSARRF